jgi:hypothetical protein
MEATPTPVGLILSQQRYILDLLKKSNMTDAKPVKTPMSTAHALSLISGEPLTDPTSYRNLVGALQYLSLTRLDISFAVNKVSQFMHRPTSHHLQAIKRILRYLKSTISYGKLLRRSSSTTLQAFSNADWAGCPDNRKSTGGLCVFLGPNLISWSSCKNKKASLAPALNLNITPLLPSPHNSFGFNPCSVTLAFILLHHPPYGVTTLGPPASLPTPPSMLGPNTSKLTSTSFVIESPPKPCMFVSSPVKTTRLTSSPKPLPHLTSPSCEPSSTSCAPRLTCGGVTNHQRKSLMNHQRKSLNNPHKATHNGYRLHNPRKATHNGYKSPNKKI